MSDRALSSGSQCATSFACVFAATCRDRAQRSEETLAGVLWRRCKDLFLSLSVNDAALTGQCVSGRGGRRCGPL